MTSQIRVVLAEDHAMVRAGMTRLLQDIPGVEVAPTSQFNTYGVLKLTLQSGSYQWEFVPVSGQSDFGNGLCH